jgi:hypothetical protein
MKQQIRYAFIVDKNDPFHILESTSLTHCYDCISCPIRFKCFSCRDDFAITRKELIEYYARGSLIKKLKLELLTAIKEIWQKVKI